MTKVEDKTIPHVLLAKLVRDTVGGTQLAMDETPEALKSTGFSGLDISFVRATIPDNTVTYAGPRGIGYKELNKISDSLYSRVLNRITERVQQNKQLMSTA